MAPAIFGIWPKGLFKQMLPLKEDDASWRDLVRHPLDDAAVNRMCHHLGTSRQEVGADAGHHLATPLCPQCFDVAIDRLSAGQVARIIEVALGTTFASSSLPARAMLVLMLQEIQELQDLRLVLVSPAQLLQPA